LVEHDRRHDLTLVALVELDYERRRAAPEPEGERRSTEDVEAADHGGARTFKDVQDPLTVGTFLRSVAGRLEPPPGGVGERDGNAWRTEQVRVSDVRDVDQLTVADRLLSCECVGVGQGGPPFV
jgi:hypothetical protein